MLNLSQIFGGLLFSGLIGWVGYRAGSLSASGVLGAMIVGTLIFGMGGWMWGLVLIAFFVSSSFLSHYRQADKEGLAEKFAKGHRRDLGQALANGGWGAVLAFLYAFSPNPLLWPAFLGTMAAVNADTWATELGVLSPTPPRLITNGRRVPVGSSGGVSTRGTLAALGGGLFIGVVAVVLGGIASLWQRLPLRWTELWLIPAAVVGGLAGSFFDSLLGATVQAIYYCDACQKETERTVHRCGAQTRQIRGWRWLDNDRVNLLSSVVGGLAAALVAWAGWTLLA
ncbi:MAG: DUF92 domain-containing protein [Chloroflexota bacterium]|nr:DUF92 domain-containing protein [Chloroflexota bacterium]